MNSLGLELINWQESDASQLATRLLHLPNPLAFLGYWYLLFIWANVDGSLFFPSVLVGPSFDYATYDSLILHTIYDITPSRTSTAEQQNQRATRRRIPLGRKRVAYLHLVLGLVFLGIYSLYGERAAYRRILNPTWYTWSIAPRFGFIQIAGIIARVKYYAVWSLSEVSIMQEFKPDFRVLVYLLGSASMATTSRQVEPFGIGSEI